MKCALSIVIVTQTKQGIDHGIPTGRSMMALMAHSGAKNGPPKANEKHEKGIVISIIVGLDPLCL